MRKPARRRLDSITRLRGLLRVSRDQLDLRLRRLLAARSEAGFSYRPIVDHLDDELIAVERRLAEDETAYGAAQLQPPQLRRQRDELATDLHDHYDSTRQLLTGVFSRRYGGGLVEPAPRSAQPLIRHVRLTTSLLRSLTPDSPALSGVDLDPGALAGELTPLADRLDAVCTALEEACATVQISRASADQALADADRIVSWVARSLEGLYRLGGLDELAERIRAAARR